MDKKELERTEEMLHRSLKELNDKGEYNGATLDLIGKAIDAIKDIHMIKGEENPSYGRGDWTAEGHYGRRMPDYRYYGKRDGDGDGRYNESYRGYEGRGEHHGNRGYDY